MAARYTREIATELINKFDARPEMLVQILHLFMGRFGFIGEDAIRQLAGELNLSRAEVHGVVSFYHDFRTVPAGKRVIKICQAESCQAMGSQALTAHAEASLGVSLHETTEDGATSLEPVYCLGNCACSPAVMVGDRVYGRVDAKALDAIIAAEQVSDD
jgi:formate dehydrogenase subunit gamma